MDDQYHILLFCFFNIILAFACFAKATNGRNSKNMNYIWFLAGVMNLFIIGFDLYEAFIA